mgnify:CR=1 FL=1
MTASEVWSTTKMVLREGTGTGSLDSLVAGATERTVLKTSRYEIGKELGRIAGITFFT